MHFTFGHSNQCRLYGLCTTTKTSSSLNSLDFTSAKADQHIIYKWAALWENQRGFWPGLTQTRLYSHWRWLEAWNFVFRKKKYCIIQVAKTKAQISFAVTSKLICVFFAYAKRWFLTTRLKWPINVFLDVNHVTSILPVTSYFQDNIYMVNFLIWNIQILRLSWQQPFKTKGMTRTYWWLS